jgi:hypothetical protein
MLSLSIALVMAAIAIAVAGAPLFAVIGYAIHTWRRGH